MRSTLTTCPACWPRLDPHADLAERHLWLIHVLHWMRSAAPSIEVAMAKAESFVCGRLKPTTALRLRLQLWWQRFSDTVDITTLLADFGFAPRTAMVTELTERLRLEIAAGHARRRLTRLSCSRLRCRTSSMPAGSPLCPSRCCSA